MGPLKMRTRRNGAANKGGVAERGPERSEDRQCPLRFGAAVARIPKINRDLLGWGSLQMTRLRSSRKPDELEGRIALSDLE